MNKKIIVIMPAKSYSKRLPNKNMFLVDGKPLLYYTIKIAKECKLVHSIYVSTDNEEITEFCKREGVSVIKRPVELCGDTPVLEVYRHALMHFVDKDIDYIIGLQPDHPDRTQSLENLIQYALKNDLDDLISVDSKGYRNGSIRIMKVKALKEGKISEKIGSMMDDAINIHSLKYLRRAEVLLKYKDNESVIKIKNKLISKHSPVFVIAEGASNHMCDIEIAKKMIDEAESAGADAIKFQTYKAERLVIKDATSYWNYSSNKSQYEYYKNLDKFDSKEYKALFDYARNKEIVVFSSPFDIESADMLNNLGMPLFKIASCLINNHYLLKHVAEFGKPIILSTGGSKIEEIEEAVDAIYSTGNSRLILLACTLSYPVPLEDAHLLRIKTLFSLFPEAVIGYSDHTEPDENMIIPSLAVALGAKVIEKHFTLNRKLTGSGHSFSVEPLSLKKMIINIRLTERVLGNEAVDICASEQPARESARFSLVAKIDIKKGELFSKDNITFKRPGSGIPANMFDAVIGKQATRDIKQDEFIMPDCVEE